MKLTPSIIQSFEEISNKLNSEITRTLPFRDSGIPKLYAQWKTAIENWHDLECPFYHLWTSEFKKEALIGDRQAIEDILTFLEADPFFFRSGYLKETLIKILKTPPEPKETNPASALSSTPAPSAPPAVNSATTAASPSKSPLPNSTTK